MSYQPEERYWTDYLRIALPAIGLVLLIGVFWYWAGALIGGDDDGGDGQVSEVTLADVPDIDASPTAPTSSPVPTLAPSPGPPPTPATNAAPPTPVPPTPTTEPEETAEASTCGANATTTYEVGQTVVTNSNVNMRQEASTSSDVVEELDAGTELEIRGGFVDGGEGQCDWWPVTRPGSGQEGFVREDLLQPAGDGQ